MMSGARLINVKHEIVPGPTEKDGTRHARRFIGANPLGIGTLLAIASDYPRRI